MDFVPARGSRVGVDGAGQPQAGLLPEVGGPVEDLGRHVSLADDALAQAGPITDDEENDLAADSGVVHPTRQGNRLICVTGKLINLNYRMHGRPQ